MVFMNEIYHFKKIFWDIEKATKKCVHLNGAIEFNKTCLTNGIFTKYCHIYIYIYIYIKLNATIRWHEFHILRPFGDDGPIRGHLRMSPFI